MSDELRCHNVECDSYGQYFDSPREFDVLGLGRCVDTSEKCPDCGQVGEDADEPVPERCEVCWKIIDDCICHCRECGGGFPKDELGDPIRPKDGICRDCSETARADYEWERRRDERKGE